jgi:hypothetical protein
LKDLCGFIGFQPIKLHNSGTDAAYTLVVLLSLASKMLGNDTHVNLEEAIQAALMSAKTANKKEGKLNRRSRLMKIGQKILTVRTF